MKTHVIVFPGSNCDRDVAVAIQNIIGSSPEMVWHKDSTINKWQLYKIARFCDAVNEEGEFEGVSDGHGGLEPRFSCNIVFEQGDKIYDAINTIVSLFRGSVYFGSNEGSFVDDRPRTPVNLITNESVKDGQFAYSNHRRDETFNTIEVSYNDRFAAYLPNYIQTVESFLASSSIGAIWSSCSPDFGTNGVIERFSQINPKILIICDRYFYN